MKSERLSDQQLINELEQGRQELLTGKLSQTLLPAVRRRSQVITPNVYIVQWTPEQREDLIDVLVDGETVVQIELPRVVNPREISFQIWDVSEYLKAKRGQSRTDRRRLEVALQLAAEHKA